MTTDDVALRNALASTPRPPRAERRSPPRSRSAGAAC